MMPHPDTEPPARRIARQRNGLRIGETSKRVSLTPRALRLYEDCGLISAVRDEAGHRMFDEQHLYHLEHIALARKAGFSLADIKRVLGAGSSDELVREICARRGQQLRQQLNSLVDLETAILGHRMAATSLLGAAS